MRWKISQYIIFSWKTSFQHSRTDTCLTWPQFLANQDSSLKGQSANVTKRSRVCKGEGFPVFVFLLTLSPYLGSICVSEQTTHLPPLPPNINPNLLSVDCSWVKGGVSVQLPRYWLWYSLKGTHYMLVSLLIGFSSISDPRCDMCLTL